MKKDDMVTLGVDLATKTGWAYDSYGIVSSGAEDFNCKPSENLGRAGKFFKFRKWLRDTLDLIKPDVVAYERVERHTSTAAAHCYGAFEAFLMVECLVRQIPLQPHSIQSIKIKATCKGNASKQEMIDAAKIKWPSENIWSDDQADALWIMQCQLDL